MKRAMVPLAMVLAAAGLTALAFAQARKQADEKTLQNVHTAAPSAASAQDESWRSVSGVTVSPEVRARGQALAAPGNKLAKEARALLRQGRLEEAERKCRQAQAFFRGSSAVHRADFLREDLGNILLARGEYKEALANYAIARHHSANAELPLHMALCYIRLGDFEKAKQLCPSEELVAAAYLDPAQADYLPGIDNSQSLEASLLLVLGVREFLTVEPEAALSYLEPASKLAPRNWFIANTVGDALYDLKRYKEAVPYYLRAEQYSGGKISYRSHQRAHPEKYLGVPARR